MLTASPMSSSSSGLFLHIDSLCHLVPVLLCFLFHTLVVVLQSIPPFYDSLPLTPVRTVFIWAIFFFHISCLNWDWIAPQLIYSLKDLSLFLTVFLRTPLLGWPFFSPLTCSATHMGRVCSCVLYSLPLTNESLSLCRTNPVIVRTTSYELWISGRANHPALFSSSKCLGPLNQLVKILSGLFLGLYWVYSLIWRELTSLWYCSISRIWCLYVINNIF